MIQHCGLHRTSVGWTQDKAPQNQEAGGPKSPAHRGTLHCRPGALGRRHTFWASSGGPRPEYPCLGLGRGSSPVLGQESPPLPCRAHCWGCRPLKQGCGSRRGAGRGAWWHEGTPRASPAGGLAWQFFFKPLDVTSISKEPTGWNFPQSGPPLHPHPSPILKTQATEAYSTLP